MLFVRRESKGGATGDVETTAVTVSRHAATDLMAEGGTASISADSLVARNEAGPFLPLARALEQDGRLRDELAAAIAIPSLHPWHKTLRWIVLMVTVGPMAMLLELDRRGFASGPLPLGRIAIDLALVVFVTFELSRPTPRMPAASALSLVALALRWAMIPLRVCGEGVSPLLYVAAALLLAAATSILTMFPSRARVSLELMSKLGITRSQAFEATRLDEPGPALLAMSVGCAAGLPALLHVIRASGGGVLVQAVAVVAFGGLCPIAARRLTDFALDAREEPVRLANVLAAIGLGFALTASLTMATRLFLDGGLELARCVHRLDEGARIARAAESAEVARAANVARESPLLFLLAVVAYPFAEERVFRGLLSATLTRRFGRAYGIFAAAVAFGLAHVGIYHVALYQTVLLGIGFGVAYAEGGLFAAWLVHSLWNLLQLV